MHSCDVLGALTVGDSALMKQRELSKLLIAIDADSVQLQERMVVGSMMALSPPPFRDTFPHASVFSLSCRALCLPFSCRNSAVLTLFRVMLAFGGLLDRTRPPSTFPSTVCTVHEWWWRVAAMSEARIPRLLGATYFNSSVPGMIASVMFRCHVRMTFD